MSFHFHLFRDSLHSRWAWIFILEGLHSSVSLAIVYDNPIGLFTVLFGLCSYFLVPATPNHARFLSSDEKEYVAEQLRIRGAVAGIRDEDDRFSWAEVLKAFKAPQVLFMAITFFPSGTQFHTMHFNCLSSISGTTLFGLA